MQVIIDILKNTLCEKLILSKEIIASINYRFKEIISSINYSFIEALSCYIKEKYRFFIRRLSYLLFFYR